LHLSHGGLDLEQVIGDMELLGMGLYGILYINC